MAILYKFDSQPILSETKHSMKPQQCITNNLPSAAFKIIFGLLFIAVFLFIPETVSSQKIISTLHLKSGDVLIKEIISDDGIKAELNKGRWSTQTYAVLVFEKAPTAEQIQRLANSGVEFLYYFPDNAYQVRFQYTASVFILKEAGVKSVVQLDGTMKYGKALQSSVAAFEPSATYIKISIQLHPGVDARTVLPQLQQSGFELTDDKFFNGGILTGNISKSELNKIASLPVVGYVNLAQYELQLLNQNERGFYGLSGLTSLQGASRNLNGSGVTVGVGDNADPSSHIDNQLNLINRNPNIISGSAHGTLVTSIVAGDGIIREYFAGTAPGTQIVSDYFDYILTKTPAYMTDFGLTITNNSYFNGLAGCVGNGEYNELSVYADNQIFNNPFISHVFAAGNDGDLTCTPYPFRYGTVKSGYQAAKNVLSVGNWNISANLVTGASSRGPVLDGRIKPEILASGRFVTGTNINNNYVTSSGTSFAAPGISGIWAMLTERYKQLNGGNPKSGLIKNILCNTARDVETAGPDYSSGYGIVNAQRAVHTIEQNQYYSNSVAISGTHSQVIAVPAGTKQLKVMLYWQDLPGSPVAPLALVNDLDLSVVDGVTTYTPLVLNPAPAFVTAPATQGVDRINNIEQVVINNPGTSVTINVNGFNVSGSQEFFISYDFVQPELKLLYPQGGERLSTFASTSRSEMIMWEANDNGTGTFKLEYSTDDGATWIDIIDGVAATDFRYLWNVPAVNTNKAKVRIRRSSGSVYATSPGSFVITNLSALTATVPCEGYVDLNWGAVTGASDYEVMQLVNGSLTSIATTSSTSYRVSGLNKNNTFWFSIRPRLTDSIAVRTDARAIVPTFGGPCADAAFDNDLKIDSLFLPAAARKFTSAEYSAAQPVTVRIKNLDNAASSTTYTVSYQINGGPVVTETPAISIASGGILDYTFTTTADLSATGNYTLNIAVTQAGDLRTENNVLVTTVKHLNNNPIVLPSVEDFETTGITDMYRSSVMGLNNIDRFDFQTSTTNGRLRTFINTGMQINGNRSLYADAAQFLSTSSVTTNSIIATYNMTGVAATPGLRFDFRFRNQGQLNNAPDNYVWMRGADNQPWIQVYNLSSNQGELGEVKRISFNINEIIANAGQILTSSFQVRFDQSGRTSSNNGVYEINGDLDDGFSFDDVRIVAATNDITVTQLVAPATFNCNAGAFAAITIRVKNTTSSSFTNVPVFYRVDNGAAVAGSVASLLPNATVDYTFTVPADFSVFKEYKIDAWASLPGDDYALNDSITNQLIYNSPVITSYPYLERFETGDGNFFTTGSYSSWKWGATDAARTFLKRAANGNNAWFTDLTAGYKNNENSYLYSPCYDLSSLTTPVLSFAHISQQQDNFDFHTIEYTVDNGNTWQRLGLENGGTNWFTSSALTWRFSIARWHVSSVVIPTNASSVRFRFLLNSDIFTQGEGIGIDDIRIGEGQTIYTGTNVTGITQTITGGSNWVHFSSGGNLVASINPLGQNMGSTTVDVYFNTTGIPRFNNNQYYLDRNLVIKPSNLLTDSVLVRFYFTETEAAGMIAANNCGTCSNISDAFIAGVTKYSGINENGTLDDNTPGSTLFISPVNADVIPFNNGYYVEFKVRSFSEFWINSGGPNLNVPLPVTITQFTGTKRYPHIDLQWKTENETNSSHFEIERKIDGEQQFTFIDRVNASGNSSHTMNYGFADLQALTKGRKFQYRLKMVDADGRFSYSNIITLIHNGEDVFIVNVFANQSSQLQIITGNKQHVRNMNIRITNTAGQMIMQLQNSYSDMRMDVSKLPTGIYFIEIKSSDGDSFIQKFVKQ